MKLDNRPRSEHLKRAAEWFAAMNDVPVPPEVRQAWAAWLSESDEHQKAWLEIEKTHQSFLQVARSEQSEAAVNLLSNPGARLSRRSILSIAALSSVGLFGALNWPTLRRQSQVLAADITTRRGEVRRYVLPDQSVIWLSTQTAINTRFNDTHRSLNIVTGDVYIATHADPLMRRFIVETSTASFEALGTQFSIRARGKVSELTVTEGAVRVEPRRGAAKVVAQGERAFVTARQIRTSPANNRQRPSWIDGLLMVEDVTLSALIAELMRYHYIHIEIHPSIADLKVTGSYPVNDMDKALALISSTFDLATHKHLPWWYGLEPRQ